MHPIEISEHLPDWIQDHMRRYLETDGEDGHLWDSTAAGGPGLVPTLLLTTVGRKSGKPRTLPLIYGCYNGGFVVVASKGGAPEDPAWYQNLVENPEVEVKIGPQRLKAHARTATAEERPGLWATMNGIYAPYDDYQAKTDREIPVVVLEPVT